MNKDKELQAARDRLTEAERRQAEDEFAQADRQAREIARQRFEAGHRVSSDSRAAMAFFEWFFKQVTR